jgi:hypothetical protein
MTDAFEVRETVPGRMVEAWTEEPPMAAPDALRVALCELVSRMRPGPGDVLRATYTSPDGDWAAADGVLTGPEGVTALRAAAVHGIGFERVYATPSMGFAHHLRYELGPPAGPRHWRPGDVVASARMSVATLGELHHAEAVWWSTRGAHPRVGRRTLSPGARFAVDVELSGPREADLPRLLRPLVYGVIAGCQAHDQPATLGDLAARVAERLGVEREVVAERLSDLDGAPLGPRTMAWPCTTDSRCVAGELRWGGRRPGWALETRIVELAPLD